MISLRWVLAPLATLALVFALACGGDDGSPTTPATGATGATAATGATGTTGGTGGASSQVLDLSQAANRLQEVESFRFNMRLSMDFDAAEMEGEDDDLFGAAFLALLGNIEASGAYVAPDSYDMSMQFFGMTFRMVQIGDEAWLNEGSGWVAVPPEEGLGFFEGESPADLPFQFLPEEVLEAARVTPETVNGEQTLRYTFDRQALIDLADDLGEDIGDLEELETMDLDVWVNQDEVPVRILMKVEGTDEDGSRISFEIEFNITDINDGSIRIERPV